MRYMMLVKATVRSEARVMPTAEQFAEMGVYNEKLRAAGVLVDLSGLRPTADGTKIRFRKDGKVVTSGPFSDDPNLVAGYWIINVKTPEEALEWAKQAPDPAFGAGDGEIELRRFFEPEDFA